MMSAEDAKQEPRLLHSREAEDATVSACLVNADMFPLARAIAAPEDFHYQKNRWLWEAMDRLAARDEPIDITTVGCELAPDRLKELGGMGHLMGLSNLLGSSLNAEAYARTVHNFAVLRQMVETANHIAVAAYRDGADGAEVSASAYNKLRAASLGISDRRTPGLVEVLGEVQANLESRTGGLLPGLATGLPTLDYKLGGGLAKGELILISGFGGGGKTAFMTQVAAHVGRTHWARFHSLEMPVRDIAYRMLAQHTGVNLQVIRTGRLEEPELKTIAHAVKELGGRRIELDGGVPSSIPQIKPGLMRAVNEGRLDLVLIDYAGLLSAPGLTEYEQNRWLSRELKGLAKEIDKPLLVALQLNRRSHDEQTPKLHHLRGSGTWEQDADVVLLLYPRSEGKGRGGVAYRLEIAKQRNGPTGFVDLVFHPETTRFEEA